MAFLPYFLLIIFLIMQKFEQKSAELDIRFVFIQVKRFDVWVGFHAAQLWISRYAPRRNDTNKVIKRKRICPQIWQILRGELAPRPCRPDP